MNNYNDFRRIAIRAFLDARNCTFEAFYKSVCRWYSREFHTPLSEVLGYSEEFVLRTHLEDSYWKMFRSDDEKVQQEIENVRQKLLKSEEELQKEVDEDEAWIKEFEARIGQSVEKAVDSINPNLSREIREHKDIVLSGESGPPEE